MEHHPRIGPSCLESGWMLAKNALGFVAFPSSAASAEYVQNQELPEIVIVRRMAQWSAFPQRT
jgi:hypothetical protein